MNSVAEVFKERAIGVIMTGMGSDGAIGMSSIFRKGGLTIGQDQASCAVYRMPRACAQFGVLTRVLSLLDIPSQLMMATRQRKVRETASLLWPCQERVIRIQHDFVSTGRGRYSK